MRILDLRIVTIKYKGYDAHAGHDAVDPRGSVTLELGSMDDASFECTCHVMHRI